MIELYNLSQEEFFKNNKRVFKAIIIDPPYQILRHKIETPFCFETLCKNSFNSLTNDGFFVYFGYEPTMSNWNVISKKYFKYIKEIIWFKRKVSIPVHYPLRTYEKIIIFGKKNAKLNRINVDWLNERKSLEDLYEINIYHRALSEIKRVIREAKSIKEIQQYGKQKVLSKSVKCNEDYKSLKKKQYKAYKRYACFLKGALLTDLWSCPAHNKQKFNKKEYNINHPTVKPIQILERLVKICSNENEDILDCFMGSGTTGIACKNLNRNFVGVEILKEYYDIAEKRILNNNDRML